MSRKLLMASRGLPLALITGAHANIAQLAPVAEGPRAQGMAQNADSFSRSKTPSHIPPLSSFPQLHQVRTDLDAARAFRSVLLHGCLFFRRNRASKSLSNSRSLLTSFSA